MPDKFTTRVDYQRGIADRIRPRMTEESEDDIRAVAARRWARQLDTAELRRCLYGFNVLTDREKAAVHAIIIEQFLS